MPTVLSDYQINGDWPGYAQEAIEKRYPEAVALFVNGCSADQNPLPRRKVELAQRYGDTIAIAVDDVLKREMRVIGGPLRAVFDEVALPFRVPTEAELKGRLNDRNRRFVGMPSDCSRFWPLGMSCWRRIRTRFTSGSSVTISPSSAGGRSRRRLFAPVQKSIWRKRYVGVGLQR